MKKREVSVVPCQVRPGGGMGVSQRASGSGTVHSPPQCRSDRNAHAGHFLLGYRSQCIRSRRTRATHKAPVPTRGITLLSGRSSFLVRFPQYLDS